MGRDDAGGLKGAHHRVIDANPQFSLPFLQKSLLCNSHVEGGIFSFFSLKHLALFKSWEQKNTKEVFYWNEFPSGALLLLLGKWPDMQESLDTLKTLQLMLLLLKCSLYLTNTED